MIVVANTSPLNYLVLIGAVDALRLLYGQVVVPAAVLRELTNEGSPPLVRAWTSAVPDRVDIRGIVVPEEAGLEAIDEGEAEVIALAETLRPQVPVIIDDRDADERPRGVVSRPQEPSVSWASRASVASWISPSR